MVEWLLSPEFHPQRHVDQTLVLTVMPAFGRGKQEDEKFRVIFCYIVRLLVCDLVLVCACLGV